MYFIRGIKEQGTEERENNVFRQNKTKGGGIVKFIHERGWKLDLGEERNLGHETRNTKHET